MCNDFNADVRRQQNKSVLNNNNVSVDVIREWLKSAEI